MADPAGRFRNPHETRENIRPLLEHLKMLDLVDDLDNDEGAQELHAVLSCAAELEEELATTPERPDLNAAWRRVADSEHTADALVELAHQALTHVLLDRLQEMRATYTANEMKVRHARLILRDAEWLERALDLVLPAVRDFARGGEIPFRLTAAMRVGEGLSREGEFVDEPS